MVWPFSKKKQNCSDVADVLERFYAHHTNALFEALAECAPFGNLQRALLSVECDSFSYFITDFAIAVTKQHEACRDALHGRVIAAMERKYDGVIYSDDGMRGELAKRLESYTSIIKKKPNALDALPACAKAMCDWYDAGNINDLLRGQKADDSEGGGIFTRLALTAKAVDFSQYYTTVHCVALANVLSRSTPADLNDTQAFEGSLRAEIAKLNQQAHKST